MRLTAADPDCRNLPAPAGRIGRTAIRALYSELALYPKPGLVSPVDAGSHDDMDMTTFMRSLFALRGYFSGIAAAGAEDAGFGILQTLGVAAEHRMLTATGGVNTHRGAIFCLGLLAAAAGWRHARGLPISRLDLGRTVAARWGNEIEAAASPSESHGQQVLRRYGAGGARREAARGFPTLHEVAVPELCSALDRSGCARRASVQTLFAIMAVLDDTNLLHRGGMAGLTFVKEAAKRFLDRGGVFRSDWETEAVALHQACVARHLSPGGAADVLATAWFVHALSEG
jgi:triphosphoribosyl-dephospho-CoA synthase